MLKRFLYFAVFVMAAIIFSLTVKTADQSGYFMNYLTKGVNRVNKFSLQAVNAEQDGSTALNEIYSSDKLNFSIYESRLLDTYFIACAIYFDFDSTNLLPDTDKHSLYMSAKNYFIKYKEHKFIQNMGAYVDSQYKAERGGVVYPLLMLSFSDIDYGMDIGTLQTDVFQDASEFNIFLESLREFYLETNANAFFDNAVSQKEMVNYLKAEMPKSDAEELILRMEEYTGNRNDLYGDREIRYRSVVTLFRPFHASFYNFNTNDATYFVGQLSPTTSEKNPDKYDINQFVETTIHEFLHNYINQPVYELNETILEMAKDKNKSSVTGNNQMYQMMDWHRIVDEYVVRAVETSIYANMFNDRDKAYDEIMRKEVELGGMQKLPDLYDSLKRYEENRDTYTNIASYLRELIDVMFRG